MRHAMWHVAFSISQGGDSTMNEMLKQSILDRLAAQPGKIGFYYKNLATGEELMYQEQMPMMAASVIKLFIMAEAYRQIQAGTLSKDQLVTIHKADCVPSCGALTYMHEGLQVTVEDLYTLMIILSDNSATNFLIDIVGQEAVNEGIRALGYTTTQLNRKMFDTEKSSRGIQNYITAREVGDLLERMYLGQLVSPEASADMIRILKDQRLNSKIPFIIHTLPEHGAIAHKTGEDTGITHDAGIIFTREPFILVFCGNETDVAPYERLMADISLELHQANA